MVICDITDLYTAPDGGQRERENTCILSATIRN